VDYECDVSTTTAEKYFADGVKDERVNQKDASLYGSVVHSISELMIHTLSLSALPFLVF
jgi:hypothetical protein